jgi:hypothetical protein
LAAFLAKYAAPSAFIWGVARTSRGHLGAFRACFWASTTLILFKERNEMSVYKLEVVTPHGSHIESTGRPYPSESHRVSGHSHISDRSGCDKSESRKFSFPGRFSHSGMDPASGASRAGGASTSTVAFADTNALVVDDDDGVKTNELANGQANAATNTIDPSFMMMAVSYFETAY